jgi:hypothetical protein
VRPVHLAGENAERQSSFYFRVILCVSWFQLRFLGLIQPAASGQENKLEMLSHESQASELSHQPVCFPGEIATSTGAITWMEQTSTAPA